MGSLACAHCGCGELWAGLDLQQCSECGLMTDSRGRPVPPEPSLSADEAPWKDGRDSGKSPVSGGFNGNASA